MGRENLWLVKCADRDGDDVEGSAAGAHGRAPCRISRPSWTTLPWRARSRTLAGERIVGSMLAYRTDDLEQAKGVAGWRPLFTMWDMGNG